MKTFGDKLNERVFTTRNLLFVQGETSELTYQAFKYSEKLVTDSENEIITVTYPIGFRPDNTPMNATSEYKKEDLVNRYKFLVLNQLPINGIYQLVMLIEALLVDLLRMTMTEFPGKISNKKKVDAEIILECNSIEEIKLYLINSILNELVYKSPKDFSEEFEKYTGVNLLEKPAFHHYIELKATRDIYIHNLGVANEIYITKADRMARVKAGQFLPVTIQYFLQSYEYCLQVTEILEEELDKIWPSSEYRIRKEENKTQLEKQKTDAIENAIENAKPQEEKSESVECKSQKHDK